MKSEITRKLMVVNMQDEIGWEYLRTLAGGSQPLNAGELEIADVTIGQGTRRLVQLRSESAATDPIASGILFENG